MLSGSTIDSRLHSRKLKLNGVRSSLHLNIVSREKRQHTEFEHRFMNDDERINRLIERLREIQLEETELLQQVERINNRRRESARRERTNEEPTRPFRVGDRIYVLNRVRRPVIAQRSWTAAKERQGTVTGIDWRADKVFYTSDNGTETWRLSKNIRHSNDG